jgi:hypothetical protein
MCAEAAEPTVQAEVLGAPSSLRFSDALVALVVIAALTLALHHRALGGFFLADDWINMRRMESPGQMWRLFTGNWMFGEQGGEGGHLYRPIPRLSLLLDRSVWGLARPWGFHLTNLALHAANIFLLWGIAWSIWRSRAVAWAAALLFWAHPLTVEPAQWISARTDLWAAVFSFSAIWVTVAASGGGERRFAPPRFWSLLLMQLAFLAKETAVVLPVLLLGIDLWRQRGWPKGRRLWWAGTLALWGLHFLQRRWMFGQFIGYGLAGRYSDPLACTRNALNAAWFFLDPWWELQAIRPLAWILVAALLVALLVVVLRRPNHRVVLFPLGWFLLSMAPLTPLGFSLSSNTRLLYPATAAASLALAALIFAPEQDSPSPTWGMAPRLGHALVILLLAGTSFYLTGDWSHASRVSRTIVSAIADDIAARKPDGLVYLEQPPERWGRAMIFGTFDLKCAVTMTLEDRDAGPPAILCPVDSELSPDSVTEVKILGVRPAGSQGPFQRPVLIYSFDWTGLSSPRPSLFPSRWEATLHVTRQTNPEEEGISIAEFPMAIPLSVIEEL